MYQAISIVSDQFDDKLWQSYFRFLTELNRKYGSQLNSESCEKYKKRITSYIENEKNYEEYVILDDGKPVLWYGVMQIGKGTPDEFLSLYLDFDFEQLPLELSKVVAGCILDLIKKKNQEKIFYMAADSRNTSAAKSWGGKIHSRINEYILLKEKADRALMHKWLEDIPLKNHDLELKPFQFLPDKYIEEFVRLFSQSFRDMPGEVEVDVNFNMTAEEFKRLAAFHQKNGIVRYNFIIVDQNDKLIGLSTARVNPEKPDTVNQFMTGVDRNYRGRSLAKWLKAALFFKVEEEFPDYKRHLTQMRAVNEPIQHINQLMGYVKGREGHEFWISADALINYLE